MIICKKIQNVCRYTDHSDDLDEDNKGHGYVGRVGVGTDVRVTLLVQTQHQQTGHDVHEGRVYNKTSTDRP